METLPLHHQVLVSSQMEVLVRRPSAVDPTRAAPAAAVRRARHPFSSRCPAPPGRQGGAIRGSAGEWAHHQLFSLTFLSNCVTLSYTDLKRTSLIFETGALENLAVLFCLFFCLCVLSVSVHYHQWHSDCWHMTFYFLFAFSLICLCFYLLLFFHSSAVVVGFSCWKLANKLASFSFLIKSCLSLTVCLQPRWINGNCVILLDFCCCLSLSFFVDDWEGTSAATCTLLLNRFRQINRADKRQKKHTIAVCSVHYIR